MTASTAPALAGARERTHTSRRNAHPPMRRREVAGAWTLMFPYLILLLIGGIIPIGYALWVSVQQSPTLLEPNKTGFGGLAAYVKAITDFRFAQSFEDIFTVLLVWLPIMIVAIVGLALLVHASPGRFGNIMRFIYYIPGALGGVANLMLWVYLLNPSQSPLSGFLKALGFTTIKQVVASQGDLPVILAAMLLLQGLGQWIVTVNGGVAARVASQAADDPAVDRLRCAAQPGLRFPAVPRAVPAQPGRLGRAALRIHPNAVGLLVRVRRARLPRGGGHERHHRDYYARDRTRRRFP
jgi:hypothetical protein